MPEIQPISRKTFSKGIVQPVTYDVAPIDSVYLAQNFEFDTKIGAAKLRAGTLLEGSVITGGAGKDVLGLHQLITTGGTNVVLAVIDGAATATLYSYDDPGWTSEVASLTKAVKHRFLTFLDTVVMVNGTDAATCSVDGLAWAAANGNLDGANMPVGDVIIEWHDRVYITGVSGDKNRLYYSSTPTA